MMSPSMAVVRKMRSPQTMGEECPRPSIVAFHFTFLVALHSVGNPVSFEIPCPSGPRHCGQLAPDSGTETASVSGGETRLDIPIRNALSAMNSLLIFLG